MDAVDMDGMCLGAMICIRAPCINVRLRSIGRHRTGKKGRTLPRAEQHIHPIFLQEDTYRGDGLNLYAYCANSPVMYYDPSGHTMTPDSGCNTLLAKDSGDPPAGQVSNEGGSGSRIVNQPKNVERQAKKLSPEAGTRCR